MGTDNTGGQCNNRCGENLNTLQSQEYVPQALERTTQPATWGGEKRILNDYYSLGLILQWLEDSAY